MILYGSSIENIKFYYYLETETGKLLDPRRRQRKQFVFGINFVFRFFPAFFLCTVLGLPGLPGLEIFEVMDAMGC